MDRRLVIPALLIGALSLLLWSPAAMLFAGPRPESSALVARSIALTVLACTYLIAIVLVLFAIKKVASHLSRRSGVALAVAVGTLLALSLPFAGLPVLFAIRALCTTTSACEGEIAQGVPHAFFVAAGYSPQVLLVLPVLVALLYLNSAAARITVATRDEA